MIKIRKITLKSGEVRWRAYGVSTGTDPVTGKRKQRTITCKTQREVKNELAKIGHGIATGTYKAPYKGTVADVVGSYLRHGINWEENTRLSYTNALAPAAEWFGTRPARSITRADVEKFRDHLASEGRKRGGVVGTGLSPRSVNLSLQQLQAAYALAELDGDIGVNPVRHVERLKKIERDYITWNEDQVRVFLAAASNEELAAAWLLSVLGLRRGEVLGLRWCDISFTEGILRVGERTRVLVNGKVIEKGAKSKRSVRSLPLFGPVSTALMDLYALAGDAGGYVCTEPDGQPLHPDHYSDAFEQICADAGLPKCRLHDCRHSTNSLLEKMGVPVSVRAAWFGHSIAINQGTYTHASLEDLDLARDAFAELISGGCVTDVSPLALPAGSKEAA